MWIDAQMDRKINKEIDTYMDTDIKRKQTDRYCKYIDGQKNIYGYKQMNTQIIDFLQLYGQMDIEIYMQMDRWLYGHMVRWLDGQMVR